MEPRAMAWGRTSRRTQGIDLGRCHGPGSGAAIARTEAGRDVLRKGFSVLALEWKGADGFPPGSELWQ